MPEALRIRLSQQEVRRAIYLDYEGNIGKPPSLLGWRVDGNLFATIVEPLFATCERRYRASHVVLMDHQEVISGLVERAIRENRCIVTWSMHDFREMQNVVLGSQASLLAKVYRNALFTVRPWYRNTYGRRADVASLSYFSGLFDLQVPERFGAGVVGSSLGQIRSQLKDGRRYGELTPKAKTGWVSVVRHNEYDLINMEKVLRKIVVLS